MVIVPKAMTEASFNEMLQKYDWIEEIIRGMASNNSHDQDAAVQQLNMGLAKCYPNAFSSAAKNLAWQSIANFHQKSSLPCLFQPI